MLLLLYFPKPLAFSDISLLLRTAPTYKWCLNDRTNLLMWHLSKRVWICEKVFITFLLIFFFSAQSHCAPLIVHVVSLFPVNPCLSSIKITLMSPCCFPPTEQNIFFKKKCVFVCVCLFVHVRLCDHSQSNMQCARPHNPLKSSLYMLLVFWTTKWKIWAVFKLQVQDPPFYISIAVVKEPSFCHTLLQLKWLSISSEVM